jgi:hypothetical protein
VAEDFNLTGDKWQDMSVVGIYHSAHWTVIRRGKTREKLDAQIEVILPPGHENQ